MATFGGYVFAGACLYVCLFVSRITKKTDLGEFLHVGRQLINFWWFSTYFPVIN